MANYADDFPDQSGILTPGWQYQWNAPVNGDPASGSISDAHTVFSPLIYSGSFTSWTPDGDLIPFNNPDSAFLRLSAQGGHPGLADNQLPHGVARYSIASFTVDESGFYAIDNSFVGLNPVNPDAHSDGIEYLVFVNRDSVLASGVVGRAHVNTLTRHWDSCGPAIRFMLRLVPTVIRAMTTSRPTSM